MTDSTLEIETDAELDSAALSPDDRQPWVIRFLLRWYWVVLLVALASAYLAFQAASRLKLDTDIVALMPDGVPSVDNLDKVIAKIGGFSSAMVVVRSPDPDAAIEFLDDLRAQVLRQPWASSAEYAEDTETFRRYRLLYVDVDDLKTIDQRLGDRLDYEKKNIRFKVEQTPVEISIRGAQGQPPSLEFEDLKRKYQSEAKDTPSERAFRNEAGDVTIMVVLPKGDTTGLNYARQIITGIDQLIQRVDPNRYHPQMQVDIGGRVTNRVYKFEAIINDVKTSGIWSIAGILLAVMLYYRRLAAVVFIGLPLAVGFLWTFAVTQIVLGGLNLITVFLVLILFGLGIDFGIHNLSRYDEVRRRGGDVATALATVYAQTGRASLLAGITTIVGFYSLMTTSFRAFYEFGFIAGTGVGLALVAMYSVFPALMVLAEKARVYHIPSHRSLASRLDHRPFPYAWTILVVGAIVTLASAAMLPRLHFESDFSKLKTSVPKLSELNEVIKEVFPLRSDKAVVFVDTLEEVGAVVEEIERIRLSRNPQDATIEKVKSIYSVVPRTRDQTERLRVIRSIHERLREAIRLLEDFGDRNDPRKRELQNLIADFGLSQLRPSDLPPAIQRVYTGVPGSGGYLVYIYNKHSTSKMEEAQAFVDDIREIKANGKTYYPATEAMVFVDMLNLMKNDATNAVLAVVTGIVVVLIVVSRLLSHSWSLRHVVFMLIPVGLGMLWMLGIMSAFGIGLNIFNMVVLPTVLGIGIDNGIHIYHRYREEGPDHTWHVVRTTGGAAFLTTLTTMLGFAGTMTASNLGLQSLGLVACIGLGACMVSTLTCFPALLQKVAGRA